jgi:hypothetical protein
MGSTCSGRLVARRGFDRLRSARLSTGDIAVTKLIAVCAVTGLLAATGCATQQQLVGQKEDLLAAAGFQIRIADNPQRLTAMRRLPPNKFVTRVVNGQPVYLYADPLVCRCVYFGTQQNWAAYRQEVFAKQLADEAQMTALMSQSDWEWGPWGWP